MLRLPRVAKTACTLGGLIGLAGAPSVARGQPSCSWVESIQEWSGGLSWTWSHQAQWPQPPNSINEAKVQDAGSCTFDLTGSARFGFSGAVDGQLDFDDDWKRKSLLSGATLEFAHTVLSGPIGGFAPGTDALMVLELDTTACTYTWMMTPWADGTYTTDFTSRATRGYPSQVFPGTRPIPEVPGPLSFSGSVPVVTTAQSGAVDPQFETKAAAAQMSVGHGPFKDAQVSWIFEPGAPTAPPNDTCDGATFLLGNEQEDTSLATSDASDPAPSCGGGDRSVWFFFFSSANGTVEISTAGSGYSTVVSVSPMTPSCSALAAEIACGADGADVPVQSNTAYRVQIRRSTPGGTGALSVTETAPEPGVALSCAAALGALALCSGIRRSRP
jgi:hypothetical protein